MPTTSAAGNSTDIAAQPTRIPGVLLGLGLGGFVDGIVVHQLFQWHHMISDTHDHPVTTVAGLEANTFADGLFHVGTWILVLAGTMSMLLAWRHGRLAPSWRSQIGLLLTGWGLFNLVEGLINHQILGIHHVYETGVKSASKIPHVHGLSPARGTTAAPPRLDPVGRRWTQPDPPRRRRGDGQGPRRFPCSLSIRSTKEEPNSVPAASPRLPRSTSPWLPVNIHMPTPGVPRRTLRQVRTAPGPHPPDWSR